MSSASSISPAKVVADVAIHPERPEVAESLPSRPLHLAIGMFDGVHRGHQEVIRQAVLSASQSGHMAGVLTFEPHPSRVLYPQRATPLLMPLDLRIEKMLSLGVDRVLVQAFTEPYARRSAREFVPFLVDTFPSLKSLHVGENFRFGSGRGGDVAVLRETAAPLGVEVHALQRKLLAGEPISSSGIREALARGDLDSVNEMLGYPYTAYGTVISGKQLGRGLGFPTLNVPWNPEAAPCYGVYRILLRRAAGSRIYPGIANYGVRPTVNPMASPLMEVHLFENEDTPTENDQVRIALLDFIRPEKAFTSLEALREQIQSDAVRVRAMFRGDQDNFSGNF